MALLKFGVRIDNLLGKAIAERSARLKAFLIPLQRAAALTVGSVLKNFIAGGRPRKWPGLSRMTRFVRSHRAGAKNTVAMPLRDKGRLMGSITPHAKLTAQGGEFGAGSNVGYAGRMHFGGKTQPNTVAIAAFTRRNPRVATRAEALSGVKLGRSAFSRVSAYTMRLKGGHDIPPRPFLMLHDEDRPRIASIFASWINEGR